MRLPASRRAIGSTSGGRHWPKCMPAGPKRMMPKPPIAPTISCPLLWLFRF